MVFLSDSQFCLFLSVCLRRSSRGYLKSISCSSAVYISRSSYVLDMIVSSFSCFLRLVSSGVAPWTKEFLVCHVASESKRSNLIRAGPK